MLVVLNHLQEATPCWSSQPLPWPSPPENAPLERFLPFGHRLRSPIRGHLANHPSSARTLQVYRLSCQKNTKPICAGFWASCGTCSTTARDRAAYRRRHVVEAGGCGTRITPVSPYAATSWTPPFWRSSTSPRRSTTGKLSLDPSQVEAKFVA